MRMQLQALIRAAKGRPLTVMFPFVAQFEEYTARAPDGQGEMERERRAGPCPARNARDRRDAGDAVARLRAATVLREVDFISIGGNDLKQFFFAADRENERVRRRYDTLNVSFLTFIEQIVQRCAETGTPLSFLRRGCGPPGRGAVPSPRWGCGRCRCARPPSGR
jgi:phosphotransferase system enzyme I (PtsP)